MSDKCCEEHGNYFHDYLYEYTMEMLTKRRPGLDVWERNKRAHYLIKKATATYEANEKRRRQLQKRNILETFNNKGVFVKPRIRVKK